MPNRLSDFEINLQPEKLVWKQHALGLMAETTLGVYFIKKGGYLTFHPKGAADSIKLGRFKEPKRVARRHFNEEA